MTTMRTGGPGFHGQQKEGATPEVVGVDIGGVIIEHVETSDVPMALLSASRYLEAAEVSNAMEGLACLVRRFQPANVWIVSKAGPEIQQRSLHWFEHHDVYDRTGLLRQNVVFVRKKRDKAAVINAKHITLMIDDSISVLRPILCETPAHVIWFGKRCCDRKHRKVLPKEDRQRVTSISRWTDIITFVWNARFN